MLLLAEKENLNVVTMKRESHSAKKTGQRPVFNEIIDEIRQGKFNGILTWAPDRISRNAGDLGKIVDLMDAGHTTSGTTSLTDLNASSLSFSNSQSTLIRTSSSFNITSNDQFITQVNLSPGGTGSLVTSEIVIDAVK